MVKSIKLFFIIKNVIIDEIILIEVEIYDLFFISWEIIIIQKNFVIIKLIFFKLKLIKLYKIFFIV